MLAASARFSGRTCLRENPVPSVMSSKLPMLRSWPFVPTIGDSAPSGLIGAEAPALEASPVVSNNVGEFIVKSDNESVKDESGPQP